MWRSVGPGLRVLPLTPQIAFAIQSGDPVFRPPEAGGFVRFCQSDPLPVLASPFRTPIASRSLPARWTRRGCRNVLVPVATMAFLVTGFVRSVETIILTNVTRIAAGFLLPLSATLPVRMLGQVRTCPGKRVKCAFRPRLKSTSEGAGLPTVPGLSPLPAYLREVSKSLPR